MRNETDLSAIYKSATNCLEGVESKIAWLEDERDQICFSVIAEDLESLVEECELYFISQSLQPNHFCSIKSRYETVLEELECLISASH